MRDEGKNYLDFHKWWGTLDESCRWWSEIDNHDALSTLFRHVHTPTSIAIVSINDNESEVFNLTRMSAPPVPPVVQNISSIDRFGSANTNQVFVFYCFKSETLKHIMK